MRRMIHGTVATSMVAVVVGLLATYGTREAGRSASSALGVNASRRQAAASEAPRLSASVAQSDGAGRSRPAFGQSAGKREPTLAPPAALAKTTYGQIIEVRVQVEQTVASSEAAGP